MSDELFTDEYDISEYQWRCPVCRVSATHDTKNPKLDERIRAMITAIENAIAEIKTARGVKCGK